MNRYGQINSLPPSFIIGDNWSNNNHFVALLEICPRPTKNLMLCWPITLPSGKWTINPLHGPLNSYYFIFFSGVIQRGTHHSKTQITFHRTLSYNKAKKNFPKTRSELCRLQAISTNQSFSHWTVYVCFEMICTADMLVVGKWTCITWRLIFFFVAWKYTNWTFLW